MTINNSSRIKKNDKSPIAPLICVFLTGIMLFFGNELKSAVIEGMRLAAMRIIPTVFPFMVLSDLWMSCIEIKRNSRVARCFENLLGINGSALIALLSGIFCGFPLGVKTAVNLYESGAISKDELERICPVVNLPSIAFVISGVGSGLFRDAKIGILLYISVFLASIAAGIITKRKCDKSPKEHDIQGQNFDLVTSIQDAGAASLTMAAYITFFSAVIGMINAIVKKSSLTAILSTLFEIGNSTSLIARDVLIPPAAKLALIAFALGFSGFSVHLQAFSFMPSEVFKQRYLLTKLLIGILSAILILPLALICGII